MKRYKITYSEAGETQTVIYRGHDADHAIERLMDSFDKEGGSEGVEIEDLHEVEIRNGIAFCA